MIEVNLKKYTHSTMTKYEPTLTKINESMMDDPISLASGELCDKSE